MTDKLQQVSWLSAIAEAAREQDIPLPPFTGHAMGSARTEKTAHNRFVTFRRRLVPTSAAENDGIEWGLWQEQGDLPGLVACFREPLHPTHENIAAVLSVLKGWLVDEWTPEAAQGALGRRLITVKGEKALQPHEAGTGD